MAKPREFKFGFKARLVLQVLTGTKSAAPVCRNHKIHEPLFTYWKNQFLEHASILRLVNDRERFADGRCTYHKDGI